MIVLLIDYWSILGSSQQLFFILALVVTLLLLIYLLYILFPVEETAVETPSDRGNLRILSALAAFGWAGFVVQVMGGNVYGSLIVGLLALATVLRPVLGRRSGQQSGNFLTQTGNVSSRIPPHQNGHGKIFLTERGVRRELDAVTAGHELEEGAPVRVVGVIGRGKPTVVVEKFTSSAPSQK